jgi:hypothetical protein
VPNRSNHDTAGQVSVSGNAYAFVFGGNTDRLEGAEIGIDEFPEIGTVAGPDGAYRLQVPDRALITPYVSISGYHRTYLQTFFTCGRDLERVNFQTPGENVYNAMAEIVGAERDPESNELLGSAVVSTFFQKEGRDFEDFNDFHDFRPHGIADAEARLADRDGASPVEPVYFNSEVIPTPELDRSTGDGGVLWANLPEGDYTVTGSHADLRFSSFRATCRPGRLVNANPPWGLFELAPGEDENASTRAEG